jgi:hypothetical protein
MDSSRQSLPLALLSPTLPAWPHEAPPQYSR